MDIERSLISRIVNTGTIETVVARGISVRHFEDETNRSVFETIINHMTRYGAPPSRDVVMDRHPGFQLDITSDAIEYLIDVMVKKVQQREAQRSVLDIADRLGEKDPTLDIDSLFMEHAERVAQAVPSSRVSKLSDAPKRIDLYGRMMREGRIPGMPLGIPTLDLIILGVQKHELVVVTAPSSVGKSTMLQFNALSQYLAGYRPLFITLEMEGEALLRKFDTMATNFQYYALRALELHPEDMEKWETWGERVANASNDIIVIDDISECTVERVFAETLRWKPDAVFVDYFGIMTPSRVGDKDYQGMAQMAKALKRIPRATMIPLFTAAQTNRAGFKEGVRADNVADTIEIFRSADIMIGLNRDEEESPNSMEVKIIKNRDGAKGQTDMNWRMSTMEFGERTAFDDRHKAPVIEGTVTSDAFAARNPMNGSAKKQVEQQITDNPFWLKEVGA